MSGIGWVGAFAIALFCLGCEALLPPTPTVPESRTIGVGARLVPAGTPLALTDQLRIPVATPGASPLAGSDERRPGSGSGGIQSIAGADRATDLGVRSTPVATIDVFGTAQAGASSGGAGLSAVGPPDVDRGGPGIGTPTRLSGSNAALGTRLATSAGAPPLRPTIARSVTATSPPSTATSAASRTATPSRTRTPTANPTTPAPTITARNEATDDLFNCGHFVSQASAQAFLRRYPGDPSKLDPDRDGIACETNLAPRDVTPVPRG